LRACCPQRSARWRWCRARLLLLERQHGILSTRPLVCPNATCRARAHRVVCCNYRSASLWGFFGRVYSFERALAELLWKVKQGGTLEVCSATKASQSLCERSERTPFRSQLRVGAPLRLVARPLQQRCDVRTEMPPLFHLTARAAREEEGPPRAPREPHGAPRFLMSGAGRRLLG
jgi:hypothetical protein